MQVIVFTRAAPAFEDLFNTCIWFLLDINTVHTNVKKETFEYLLKLTSMLADRNRSAIVCDHMETYFCDRLRSSDHDRRR